MTANGAAVSQPFSFTASATNGGTILASLQLQNNGTNLTVVTFPFTLTLSNSFANTNNIIIPDHGPGVPYPSMNIVSGLNGIVGKVTVTFTNFNHTYPDDVDMLLVGPKGQNVLLMSHAGYNGALNGTEIEFDSGATNIDGSPKPLPSSSQILSGSYQPTQNGTVDFNNTFGGTITIPTNYPPPAQPYGTNLNIFNGTSANGTWMLYVFDSSPGDQGLIVGGWSLGIVTGNTVNPVVDLAVTGKAIPNPVLEGNNLTYSFTVTNLGPNPASVVQFTNLLPANVTFVSATNSARTTCATNGGGAVYCTFTNLAANSSATITVVVTPNAPGTLSSIAMVGGSDSDPNQSNNSTNILTTVTAPVADLAVTQTGVSNSVVGSNVLYTITVTNNGPGTALGVMVTDPTLGLLTYASGGAYGSAGQPYLSNNVVVCNVGDLASGTGAVINLFLAANQAVTVTNTVTASTVSNDPNLTNNSATVVTAFSTPAPNIIAGSPRFVSGPYNGSLVPGQIVTVSLPLANIGTADTSNLMATLLPANGVVSPNGPFSYGVVAHGGPAVANSYTFTVSGANGGIVTATLQLMDGNNNLGTINFPFNLPATNTFANTNVIIIPDHGPATPYPSIITVSNLAGVVSHATVTLSNFNHQFPNDVEILLVAPSGQNVVLMSGTGGGSSVSNLMLTFDDAASASLPVSSDITVAPLASGTFLPTDYGLKLPFPSPAPAKTTASTLSGALDGVVANGNWTLYVFDNSAGDDGSIANGWSLNLTSISPVNSAADLGISLTAPTGAVYPGVPMTLTVVVTNKGPSTAANVTVTNALGAGLKFGSTSLGGYSTSTSGNIIFNLGSLAVGASSNFTFTVSGTQGGAFLSTVSVSSDQTDVNTLDNIAQASLQILNPPTLSAVAGTSNGSFAPTLTVGGSPGVYRIVASTNLSVSLSNWITVATYTNTSGTSFQFTDPNAAMFPYRYYRVIFVP